MLQMKTDLLRVNRLEKLASAWVLANGKTGLWVAFDANGVGQPSLGNFGVPIFTESNRDGSAGFTGDVSVTKGVTVLFGKMEAVTDQYTGTPALGDKLYILADGTLANATDGSVTPDGEDAMRSVAICTKAPAAMEWFGNTINVIEYVTI